MTYRKQEVLSASRDTRLFHILNGLTVYLVSHLQPNDARLDVVGHHLSFCILNFMPSALRETHQARHYARRMSFRLSVSVCYTGGLCRNTCTYRVD